MGDAERDAAEQEGAAVKEFPTRFSTPGESPGLLMWQATNAWQRRIRAALEPTGLTHVQFVLLACLGWMEAHESAPTQAELARRARTDVMMTSQVVRALEERGLAARTPSPRDARARLLALTPAGREAVAGALPLVESADEAFFAAAGDALPSLVSSLRRLALADEG